MFNVICARQERDDWFGIQNKKYAKLINFVVSKMFCVFFSDNVAGNDASVISDKSFFCCC